MPIKADKMFLCHRKIQEHFKEGIMEKNKVISKLCCLETTFYIVFLTILILRYKKGLGNRTFALLIFLSFIKSFPP